MARTYREDIDWLRAIAVLSVLAFHWDIPPFRGGYVGVDVFFVISGFLITQIIQSEITADQFSFARFYERRVRRLLPALYLMVLLTILPAFWFLLETERHEFFRSIVAVVTFTSNIFFWQQTNYFAHAADEKPLLHTWSLSVEEQFYLVLPVLIWTLLRLAGREINRSRVLLIGLGVAALASFALSYWLMASGRVATAFFMSPPRAWEFLAGSLIAVKSVPVLHNIHLRRVATGVGLALVLVPAIIYRSSTPFPGVSALLPCVGAAIFIWSGVNGGAAVRATWLPLKLAGFFGKISYSLYLWHWPLFIYCKFAKPDLTPTAFDKAVLFAFAVAGSYASYRFVEQPLRRGVLIQSRRSAFAVAGAATTMLLLVAVLGTTAASNGGTDGRTKQLAEYGDPNFRPVYGKTGCFVETWSAFDESACLSMATGKVNVLLWGDSLAAHYFPGLEKNFEAENVNILQATNASCFPALIVLPGFNSACRAFAIGVATWLQDHKPDIVIISADWLGYSRRTDYDMIGEIKRTISQLQSKGIRVLVVGPSVQFKGRLPSMLLRATARNADLLPAESLVVPEIFELDRQMKLSIPPQNGIPYVSILDAVCPQRKCPTVLTSGVPLAWDHAHLTPEGSTFAVDKLMPAIKQLLPNAQR